MSSASPRSAPGVEGSSPDKIKEQAAFKLFSKLPMEFQSLILECLCENATSVQLSRYSKVSRLFYRIAQPCLYHNITLGGDGGHRMTSKRISILMKRILKHPELALRVEGLNLLGKPMDDVSSILDTHEIDDMIAALPSAERLHPSPWWLKFFENAHFATLVTLAVCHTRNLQLLRVANDLYPMDPLRNLLTSLFCQENQTSASFFPHLKEVTFANDSVLQDSKAIGNFLQHPTLERFRITLREPLPCELPVPAKQLKHLHLMLSDSQGVAWTEIMCSMRNFLACTPCLKYLHLQFEYEFDSEFEKCFTNIASARFQLDLRDLDIALS